ncbi:MAG: M3 family metallopeptidase, partial [Planctomycetota bacterium]
MPTMLTDFIPAEFNAGDLDALKTKLNDLLERDVQTAAAFETWLVHRSELDAAFSESAALLYIAMTCNTDDERAAQAYTKFIETIPPAIKPIVFELDRKQKELHESTGLDSGRYEVMARDTITDVDLFDERNIPLETELAKLDQKYDTISGAMTVTFDGEEKTLPQMGTYQESTDRNVRESAWRTVSDRRLQDVDGINDIYDEMIKLRHEVAGNLGFDSYTQYAFKAKHRFDYSPEHCFAFHDACEQIVAPFTRRLDEQRQAALGVDTLRPWDLAVDVKGRPPL